MQYNDSLTRMVLTKHDRTIFQNGTFHVFSPASKSVGRWKAIVGKHNIEKTDSQEQKLSVQKIFIHPSYDSDTVANDLAILVLESKIIYSDYIKPVCLPTGENYHIGQHCITAGWGDTQSM